jgi:hypothetical protein
MSTERTRIQINDIAIRQYGNEAQAKVTIEGLVGISLPDLTVLLTPEECTELKVLTDKVIRRVLDKLRKGL